MAGRLGGDRGRGGDGHAFNGHIIKTPGAGCAIGRGGTRRQVLGVGPRIKGRDNLNEHIGVVVQRSDAAEINRALIPSVAGASGGRGKGEGLSVGEGGAAIGRIAHDRSVGRGVAMTVGIGHRNVFIANRTDGELNAGRFIVCPLDWVGGCVPGNSSGAGWVARIEAAEGCTASITGRTGADRWRQIATLKGPLGNGHRGLGIRWLVNG